MPPYNHVNYHARRGPEGFNLRIKLIVVLIVAVLAATALLGTTDPYCPAYPASQRTRFAAAEARLRQFRSYSAAHSAVSKPKGVTLADASNLIDQYIFGKMQADGVTPAPASGDSEFVRRIYLDLTGRLPTVDQAVGVSEQHRRQQAHRR